MKYRVIISTYAIIEADSKGEAAREFGAAQEETESETIADDLLLNGEIVTVTEEVDDFSSALPDKN